MAKVKKDTGRLPSRAPVRAGTKDAFIETISDLMATRRLSPSQLAVSMGQRSPAPVYRLLGGTGAIGPRLVANLASTLDEEAVLNAYATWMPDQASRARQLVGRRRVNMVPQSIVSWLEIDEIERGLGREEGWEATIVSRGEPAAAIDRRVRDIVCANVVAGGRYRYITSSKDTWIDRFARALREDLAGRSPRGNVSCFFDPHLEWALVSEATPMLELLTFQGERSPEAYLLVSNDVLKHPDDRFALRLKDRLAWRIDNESRYRDRIKDSEWEERFRIDQKAIH